MTMLPDIDAGSWLDFQRRRVQDELDKKMNQFGLNQMIDEKIAGIGGFMGSMVEAPPAPEPSPTQTAPEPDLSGMRPAPEPTRPAPQQSMGGTPPAPEPTRGFFDQFTQPVTDAWNQIRPAPEPTRPAMPAPEPTPQTWQPPSAQGAETAVGRGGDLRAYARQAARRAGVDPDVFERQIQQESGFNPNARSPAGATGVAQIVPQYHPNVDPTDPYASLDYGANLMASNLQKYEGDYSRALAAYNAGGGAVDKYGGVPPFAETQTYVKNILGGAKQAIEPFVQGAKAAVGALRGGYQDISQFGDAQLTSEEAYAACGPAAAVRFAQRFGRNPSLKEALDLAKTVGWTAQQGMAGIASQQKLMQKMGVETELVAGPQWDRFAAEAQTGNPVTISTSAHYFYADGYDPSSGAFHVGRSGTDLRGGKEWMTQAEIEGAAQRLGGGNVQGALLANNPIVPGSTTGSSSSPSPLSQIGDFFSGLGSNTQSALNATQQRIDETLTQMERGRESLVTDTQSRLAELSSGFDATNQRLRQLMGETPEEAAAPTANYGNLGPSTAPGARYSPEAVLGELQAGPGYGLAAGLQGLHQGVGEFEQGIQRGISGRLGQVVPKTYEDFTAQIQTPTGAIGEAPGLAALGTGLSALGTASKLAQDVGSEFSPFRAAGRYHTGEDVLVAQDPAVAAFFPNYTQMAPDERIRAIVNAPPEAQAAVREATQRVRQMTPEAISSAAWQNPELREMRETQYDILGGLAAMGLAPQGLASGLGRFGASLAVDPGGAALATLGELPQLAARGARAAQLVDPSMLGPGRRVATSERAAMGEALEAGRGESDLLTDNITGRVFNAVDAALQRIATPQELAAAQQTIDELSGTAALNPFPSLQTAEGLAGVRRQLRALADMGAEQRNWYDESSQKILAATQDNRADAEKLAQLVAIYSNNTPVNENMNNAMMAWTQWKRGMPIDAPTLEDNNVRARRLLEQGIEWEGAKTNNFYRNLMKNIDNDKYLQMGRETGQTGVTVDVWMMRALNALKTRKSPSPKTGQYEFAAREIEQIARERGWTPEQAQAAIWVAAKAGWENVERKVPMDLSRAGTFHYGTALGNRLAQTGLPPLSGADELAQKYGLLAPDGRVSLPKARATRGEKPVPGPAAEGAVDEASRRAMNAYVAERGINEQLPEVYWAREIGKARNLDLANGVAVDAGRQLEADEVGALQSGLDGLMGPGQARVITSDNGVWVLNQSDAPNKAFHTATKKALSGLESVPEARATPRRFDSEFISNDWSTQPNGEGYLDPIRLAGVGPGQRIEEVGGRLGRPGAELGIGPGAGLGAGARDFGAGRIPAPSLRAANIVARGAEPLRDIGVGALQGGIAGGVEAAQEPEASAADVAKGVLGGSVLGAARGAGLRGVGRFGPQVARIAEEIPEIPLGSVSRYPRPGSVPMSEDELLAHAQRIDESFAANQLRIGEIEETLEGVRSMAPVQRPPWSTGMSDRAIRGVAQHFGLNPYQENWWSQAELVRGAGEMEDVLSYFRNVGNKRFAEATTPTGLRQELTALRREQRELQNASEQLGTGGQFYRAEQATGDVPFDPIDTNGHLVPEPTDVEKKLAGRGPNWEYLRSQPADPISQTFDENGNLLRTDLQTPKARAASITEAGAEGIELPPTPDASRLLPNLSKVAADMPDLQATIAANVDANTDLARKYRGGVVTHDELANHLAAKFGLSKEEYLKSPMARQYTDAELLALEATAVKEGDRAKLLAQDVARQARERGGMSKVDSTLKADLAKTMVDGAQLQLAAAGGRSGRGRGLNALKIRMTRELAESVTTGVEARKAKEALAKAEKAQKTATTRTERTERLVQRSTEAQAERAEAIKAARAAKDKDKAGDLIKQINAAYEDLAKYRNMSLAEKDEVWAARVEAREANALARAEALREPDPLEGLLKALRHELDAEQKHFGKSREVWGDMAFWASKKDEILKGRSIEGQGEWLKAQAKAARKALENEDRLARAEFNRVLAAEERAGRLHEIQLGKADKVLQAIGSQGITDKMLEEYVKLQDSNDSLAMGRFLRRVQRTTGWDRFDILRYASMLSSTATHGTQAVSNLGQLGLRPLIHAASVPLDIAASKITGAEREMYWGELGPMIQGIFEGGKTGAKEAEEVLRHGVNVRQVARDVEHVRPGFASGVGAVDVAAEAPLRLMQASDLLFQGAARGMHSRGLATRKAIKEGRRGNEIATRAQEIMDNLPEYDDINTMADQLARKVTLQEENWTQRLASRGWEGRAVSLAVPFVRTPWNIVAQGMGLTPAGLINLMRSDRTPVQQRETIAKAMIGTMVGGLAGIMAANGHITGGYPAEEWERNALPEGWRPWSVRHVGGDGTITYVPFSGLGPLGVPMAIGAAIGETAKKMQRGEQVSASLPGALMSMGRFMADQSMLQGFNNLVNIITEPQRYGDRSLQSVIQQVAGIPYGGLQRQAMGAMGIGPRDPMDFAEAIERGEPWRALTEPALASNVLTAGLVRPKLTPLGEEQTPYMEGPGAFFPIRFGAGQDDPVLQALRGAEVNIPEAAKAYKGVPLTPDEQRRQQIASGAGIREIVAAAQADPQWARLTPTERQVVLERLIERARGAASAGILQPLGEPELERRLLAERARQAPVGR